MGHTASALPPKELETEISHVDINPCLTEGTPPPQKSEASGHRSLGELPWLAIFCAYNHTSLLPVIPWQEDDWKLHI